LYTTYGLSLFAVDDVEYIANSINRDETCDVEYVANSIDRDETSRTTSFGVQCCASFPYKWPGVPGQTGVPCNVGSGDSKLSIPIDVETSRVSKRHLSAHLLRISDFAGPCTLLLLPGRLRTNVV